MNAFRTPIFSAVTLLLCLSGCKHEAAPAQNTQLDSPSSKTLSSAPVAAPVDPAQAGSISGTVHLKGAVPERVPIDMSMDPACSLAGDNLTEQYVGKKGGLANVYVYLKAGLPASSAPASIPPVRVDQHGCRFVPHVVAVQQGGTVEFTNSDPTMHNVHTVSVDGNAGIDVSQGPGAAPQARRFNAPETMLSVRCNNHPWMNGFVNVAPNGYFAVTNEDGSFTLKGLPPGTYTLAAIHEKLGEQDTPVTVPAHGTAAANLTFTMP